MFRCQRPYVRMSVPLSATTSWVCPNLSVPMFRCHSTYVRMSVSLSSDVSPPIFQPQFTYVLMSLPRGSDVTTSRFGCHSPYLTTLSNRKLAGCNVGTGRDPSLRHYRYSMYRIRTNCTLHQSYKS